MIKPSQHRPQIIIRKTHRENNAENNQEINRKYKSLGPMLFLMKVALIDHQDKNPKNNQKMTNDVVGSCLGVFWLFLGVFFRCFGVLLFSSSFLLCSSLFLSFLLLSCHVSLSDCLVALPSELLVITCPGIFSGMHVLKQICKHAFPLCNRDCFNPGRSRPWLACLHLMLQPQGIQHKF